MRRALLSHWPEYLIEAALLGLFMVAAALFGVLLEHPESPVRAALHDPLPRRVLMGLAMGATAVGLIYSPWGRRSGAHLNPVVTLTFLRLGKTTREDALFYALFQCAGGAAGVALASAVAGGRLAHESVLYVATLPGPAGRAAAFAAEAGISFLLMLVVLVVANHPRWWRRAGLCAGALVALYISFEAPLSGMSMNPARTLASALHARRWDAFWLYVAAPLAGMLLAAQFYLWRHGLSRVLCAKLHHGGGRCIFRCRHHHGDTHGTV